MESANLFLSDADAWYAGYEICTNTAGQAQYLTETLRLPITEEAYEKGDLGGLILELFGDIFEKEKDYTAAFELLKQFEHLQPALYRNELHYYASSIFEYAMYTGNTAMVEPLVAFFKDNPNNDIDMFLLFHQDCWRWQQTTWGISLARETYKAVDEHEDYWGAPAQKLAYAVLKTELQNAFEHWQSSGHLDIEPVQKTMPQFGFNIPAAFWSAFETGLTQPWDAAQALPLFGHKDKSIFMTELDARFFAWAHHRGFPFQTAWLIWGDLRDYWNENHEKANSTDWYFRIEEKSFDKWLVAKRKMFFLDIESIVTTVWGAVFVCDFLLEHGLIQTDTYTRGLLAINNMKHMCYNIAPTNLWTASFVVKKWSRPDSLSPEIFAAEAVIFEKTFLHKNESFAVLRSENKDIFNVLPPEVKIRPAIAPPAPKQPAYEKQPRPAKNPSNAKAKKKKK